jgi:hypothetical protein
MSVLDISDGMSWTLTASSMEADKDRSPGTPRPDRQSA